MKKIYEKPYYTVFLDRSMSMKTSIDDAKAFLKVFHDILPEGMIKLIIFNGKHNSSDFIFLEDFAPELQGIIPKGSTKIWDLLHEECLKQSNIIRPKYFILLSDGHDQVLLESPRQYSKRTIDEIIPELNENNTHVISVSFNENANVKELKKLSTETKGVYIDKPDQKKVTDFFKNHLHFFYQFSYKDYFYELIGSDTREIDISSLYKLKYESFDSKEVIVGKNEKYQLADDYKRGFFLNFTRNDLSVKKKIDSFIQARKNKKPVKGLEKDDFNLFLSGNINNFFIDNISVAPTVDVLIDNSTSLRESSDSVEAYINEIIKDNFCIYNYFVLSKNYPYFKKIKKDDLNNIKFSGPTPLYDSMFNICSKGIGKERRRMIVITDGWDERMEGTRDRMSSKRAIDVINMMWKANEKLYVFSTGNIVNSRTLRLMAENTDGKYYNNINKGIIKTVLGEDIYRYRIEFSNPVWNTSIPANLRISIGKSRFLFKYMGKEWDFHPLQ